MLHLIIGVYMNGRYRYNVVRDEDLQDHIEYNKQFRCGMGWFVDGQCIHQGYLSGDQVKKWTKRISEIEINMNNRDITI